MEDEGAWLAGAAVAAFRSELRFDDDTDATLHQNVAVVSFGRRFDDRFSLRLSGGVVLGGDIESDAGNSDIDRGWLVSLTAAERWFGGDGKPFLISTLSAGMSRSTTDETPLTAIDVRLGAQFGVTLFRVYSPYLVARAFGGPVTFRDHTGSDRHHYALGFGSSVNVSRSFDIVFDATILGERAVSWGAGVSF